MVSQTEARWHELCHSQKRLLVGTHLQTLRGVATMKRSILIVEDNELARKQLQQVLQVDPELHVETIGDGMKALEELVKNIYSIVVTDLRMPRLDGMQLIKEIQQR